MVSLQLKLIVPRFEFAEQAINAIYVSSEKPDSLCGKLIKAYTSRVFSSPSSSQDSTNVPDIQDKPHDEDGMEVDEQAETKEATETPSAALKLAKLCFMVGHVAMKEIVHLEAIESEWKRRKHTGTLIYLRIRKWSQNTQKAK